MSDDPANQIASAVIQKTNIAISFKDGTSFSIDNTAPTWRNLRRAIRRNQGHLARKYVNTGATVKSWAKGKLLVQSGAITYKGMPVSVKLYDKILLLVKKRKSVNYLTRFLDNVYRNPSQDSVRDLYDFLEANNLPITEDGCFLAFKRVSYNYMDKHTGTIENHIGAIVTMPREKCDPDRRQTCSHGLHFCQPEYLEHQGTGPTMVVKINPADVVAIPTDYNRQKGRCCRLEVIAEVSKPFHAILPNTTIKTSKVKGRQIKAEEKQ